MYFAKFPHLASILNVFTIRASSFGTDYTTFKTELEALTPNSLVPDIKGYVFGQSEDVIKKQIEDIGDRPFLFLDFGDFRSDQDDKMRKNDTGQFGLTVARTIKPDALNMIESVLESDRMLNYMRTIRSAIIADQTCSPFVKRLSFPHEIVPFFARDWQNATGWSMMFQTKGIDLL